MVFIGMIWPTFISWCQFISVKFVLNTKIIYLKNINQNLSMKSSIILYFVCELCMPTKL